MNRQEIRIDIISDVVCPWCYIGKARLEKAMEVAGDAYSFSINWQPFELYPDMPEEGASMDAFFAARFGSAERFEEMKAYVTKEGLSAGLDFHFERIEKQPNTLQAHRLLFLAAGKPQQHALAERLFEAFFVEGEDISDPEFLIHTALAFELPPHLIQQFRETDRGLKEIRTLQQDYREAGINSVPTYIFNQKYIVQGGQPAGVFMRIFEKLAEPELGNN